MAKAFVGHSPCAQLSAVLLLAASSIFALVGLAAPWGTATVHIGGIFSGTGEFTLWHITVATEVIGLKLPENTFSIDDSVCGGGVPLSKVEDICSKFVAMRTCVVLTVVSTFLALVFSLASRASVMFCTKRRTLARVASACAAVLLVCAFVLALAAVVIALMLPEDDPYFESHSNEPGAGSICIGLLLLSSLAAAGMELRCWFASRPVAEDSSVAAVNAAGAQDARADDQTLAADAC